MYEQNDQEDIPEEIDELIDDYGDFFRIKSIDPVNQEMMTFYEDECIWIKGRRGSQNPRRKNSFRNKRYDPNERKKNEEP